MNNEYEIGYDDGDGDGYDNGYHDGYGDGYAENDELHGALEAAEARIAWLDGVARELAGALRDYVDSHPALTRYDTGPKEPR